LTSATDADGEIVWFWRAYAAPSPSEAERLREGDGGKRWFTEESAYKP
jgi:hypothetical protein